MEQIEQTISEQPINTTFSSPIDKEDISKITTPSIIALGGTSQIRLVKLRPENIEKYLLMHPVVPRGIEIRANRMTGRGYEISSKNKAQRNKAAAKEIQELISNSGGSVLINNLIQNAYAFGDGYLTLVPNKAKNKIVLLNQEHPVFFRVARNKKENMSKEELEKLHIDDPRQVDNFYIGYGSMKISPTTKKPEYYTQLQYDASGQYYVPVGDELTSEQVCHLFFDSWGDEVTGISVLQYIHNIVNYLLNLEEAGAENIYRNGFVQKKLTTELMTERELKEISKNIKDINVKDAIILPRGVDLENLIPGNSQFPEFHERFINLIAVRLGIPLPTLMLSGTSTNKSTIDVMDKNLMDDLKADEAKVENAINEQIIRPVCNLLYGNNFRDYPEFKFLPFRESEDAKAARAFRIAQTMDALARAVSTLVTTGYSKRAEQVLSYIDEIIPYKGKNENDELNKKDRTIQKTKPELEKPNVSKGEDADTQGGNVGRPTGTNSTNVRGKKVSPKQAPNIK